MPAPVKWFVGGTAINPLRSEVNFVGAAASESAGRTVITVATSGGATGAPSATAAVTPVNVTPVFTGTGCAASGQVITTTDNQTMTLNQCAGMLFVSNGTPGNFAVILSNTAVTGAPAVLTVAGFAQTAAGAYKIFTGATLATAAHTHTQS